MKPDLIVVAGSLAQRTSYGGHAWMFLQYLLGFRRLGFEVLFIDRVDARMGIDEATAYAGVRDVLEPFGLAGRFAILVDGGRRTLGVELDEVERSAGRALFLLDFMGFLEDERLLSMFRRRVFFDIDPGFGQMWKELGLADVLAGHDAYVTVGTNVGRPGCLVPTCGRQWLTTRQPVVLEHWPVVAGGAAFTSIGAWRGPFAPVEYEGRRYGLRVHEFRRFMELPRLTGRSFELALDIDASDAPDLAALAETGWRMVDPRAATGSPAAYRSYIQGSGAEFAAVKNMYVQARTGWFSDRSACYLASGKPVLVQDTGMEPISAGREGLLTFATLEEAASGVDAICADQDRHARAAREIAEEFFNSDTVLAALVDRLTA